MTINVLDVDEAPVFNKPVYTFDVAEERDVRYIGAVSARDPDKAKKRIEYDAAKTQKATIVMQPVLRCGF